METTDQARHVFVAALNADIRRANRDRLLKIATTFEGAVRDRALAALERMASAHPDSCWSTR